MENTIESAIKFLHDRKLERLDIAQLLFTYAASVTTEVVVPSEEWIDKEFHGFSDIYKSSRQCTIDGFKSLNPTLTFTENHEK